MPDVVFKIDRKFVQRYAESYINDELVATRGDQLLETVLLTIGQAKALERIINGDGLSVVVSESGDIKLNA